MGISGGVMRRGVSALHSDRVDGGCGRPVVERRCERAGPVYVLHEGGTVLGDFAVVKAGRGQGGWNGAARQPGPLRPDAPILLVGGVLIPQRALDPSNMDRRVEEGAEGYAAAAFPVLPCGLDLYLAGDSENHGAW